MDNSWRYKRTGGILSNRYNHYLLSTTLTAMAGSLNWFVDSLVVSRLLGSEAMSIVNICNPIMFVICTVYCCIGIGGSTLYAESLGKMDKQKAGFFFKYSVLMAASISLFLSIIGFVFVKPIAYVLCGKNNIYAEAIPYLKVMFASVLPIVFTGILSNFIIVCGKPNIATALNIISNVVNIFMDYVYIHFFSMKVAGAAVATLTGNVVALAFVFFFIFIKKNIQIEYSRSKNNEKKLLPEILKKGLAPAFNQLGFSVKILFCNNIAMSLGGLVAVTVYSVCMQTVTIVTIALSGTLGAMFPILALLKGQKDNSGIRLFVKKIYFYQFAVSAVCVVIFFIFSQNIMIAYKVPEEGIALGDMALKIFAFTHLFRPIAMIFMYYAQTIDMKKYAFVISLVDGLAGVPIAVFLLTMIYGITGLWLAFPLVALLLLVCVVITNLHISKKSNGEYLSALLLPADEKNVDIFDATVPENKDDISKITEQLQNFCEEKGCDNSTSVKVAIACEEMCEYTLLFDGNKEYNYNMDIIVKIYPDKIELNIRSLGRPLDHLTARLEEKYSNAYMLYKMASEVNYDYVMGMNQTKIIINRRK